MALSLVQEDITHPVLLRQEYCFGESSMTSTHTKANDLLRKQLPKARELSTVYGTESIATAYKP
jgi:hypothetical protein